MRADGTTTAAGRAGGPPVGAVTFGVIALVLTVAGAALLQDSDTAWHLATGEWIIAERSLPRTDPFSWTATGEPWIAKEWLSQLLYVAASRAGGWAGVVLLASLATAAAFGVLATAVSRHWSLTPTVVVVGAAFVLTAPHVLARPHVLALPLQVLWLVAVVRRLDDEAGPPWWTLGVVVVWANLHAGVALAIVLAAAAALEAVLDAADAAARRAAAVRWSGFALATIGAACVTPYGPRSLLVTLDVLGLGPALAVIPEWQPQDFSTIGPFEVVLLVAIGAALVRGVRLPPVRVLVLLGLLHLALSATRNGELLGLLAPVVLAAPLAPVLGPRLAPAPRRAGTATVVVGVVAATLVVALVRPTPPPVLRPDDAIAAITATGSTRVLNEYGFGGVLVAADVPTFVDGRTELFGGAFVADHAAALALDDVDLLDELLTHWAVEVTMLRPGTPAVDLLDRSPTWTRVHADGIAVVHVRDAGAATGLGLGG